MAKIDYNSSNFRNGAIDRLNGKFGKGPGDGLKSVKAPTVSGTSLANPFQQKTPLSKGLGDTSIKRPSAPKAPSAKTPAIENKPSAMAAEPKAPAAASRTKKDVRRETAAKVAEIKGKNKVAKLESKSAMTPEQKMELREKRQANFGKAVKGTLETVGTALGLYGTYQGIKRANKEENDGN